MLQREKTFCLWIRLEIYKLNNMLNQEQIQQIYQWWHVFKNDGDLVEIRCIGDKITFSGYYKNIENLIRDVGQHDDCNVYYTINPINESCHGRPQCEQMLRNPKNTTTDSEIIGRSWVFIDFDCKKVTNVNSTKEEKEYAHQKALEVYRFLKKEGFNEPIITDSANGFHALYPCRLAANEENDVLVSKFLKSLSMMFSDDNVDIDVKTANRSRIVKLPGTFSRKGSALSEDRPQRMCKIIKVPSEIIPTSKEYFQKIADLYPEEEIKPTRENNFSTEKFDLLGFFAKYGIEYRAVTTSLGTRYILKECPFDPSHRDPDSMVFQHNNGAIAFMCYHNSCSNYHWRDFRLHFDKDAYDKKDYKEFRSKQQYYEKYEPIKIKEETSENGKKWLDWDDIQDINDADLVAIKSGYFLLDKLIKGFVLGELSILCGLNSSGKSTILNSFALNAIQRNYPTAYFSGELRPQRLKQWIEQVAAGRTNVTKNPETERSYDVNQDVLPKISKWINGKLKIYSHEKYGNLSEQLVNDIIECIKNFGVKFILIDNLMSVSLDGESGDKNDKQKNFVIKVANVAKTYGVHIMLVVHPRKENGLQFLRKESVKGAGDITDAADNVFLIHRVGDDFEKRATEFLGKERVANLIMYDNVIEITKNRDYGVSDMFVGLYFEPESRRYKNSKAEQIHYDWEEHYEEYTVLEEPQPLPTTIQPNQAFDTPIEPLYTQKEEDAYWGQFQHDELPPF